MAYIDKYGVEYSDDKKTLVRCPEDFEGEYIIPEGVTAIGKNAFWKCAGLTSLYIPPSLKKIYGPFSFWGCNKLIGVHISDIAAWCAISMESSPLLQAGHLYVNNKEVTNLVIPDKVTCIADEVFAFCSSLTSIEIPDSVTHIGSRAFFCCDNLTSVSIGKGLTSIGEGNDNKILIAICDNIIRSAEANKQDMNCYKSPLITSIERHRITYSLKDPSVNVLQTIERLYNAFIVDYVTRVRTYIENDKSHLPVHIADFLNTCLKKKTKEDYEFLTKDCKSVPLPDIAPYQFIEGTHWSYGDLLGHIHGLCLADKPHFF
ncbi:MAG: leucine-rich repeat domain-containing protein [Paludibacteraceae bacterium]|nr:leucine-rich repeat domain-containing protein [Paludibacteraceae bacterium]